MLFPDIDIAPADIEQRVDLRDIKPTILDWLEIPDGSSDGRSLLPLLRGDVTRLPAAAPGPSRELEGENRIGGQDERSRKRPEDRLRTLGYIE